MNSSNLCSYWEPPVQPKHLKCAYRVIATEISSFKGLPICVNANKSSMRCCRENEFSYKISREISQELPEGGLPEVGALAPAPPLQSFNNATVALTADINLLSERLMEGHRELHGFSESIGNYRTSVVGRFNNVEIQRDELSDFIERNNEGECKHYVPDGNTCKNITWCFKVFGTSLSCQVIQKPEPVQLEEHRRLEVG